MTDTKLAVNATIKEGIAIGTRNIGPILVNVLLWALTAWIPYLNVGTTIGLTAGIVAKASRGEIIPMTEIFDPKYRKYMGEFFLVCGLMGIGVCIGTFFGIIPGIVIGLAWSLAILLVVDKGKNPTKALILSNNYTYGYKWRMFGIYFLTCLVFSVGQMILLGIGEALDDDGVIFVMSLIVFLSALFEIFVLIGLQASVYRQLTED
ncbi:MAG: hypothetical protein LBH20_03425 [Treponema sp.]|jgi:hypothetical protein|nr:hypothetical protein [Treponema sp.]